MEIAGEKTKMTNNGFVCEKEIKMGTPISTERKSAANVVDEEYFKLVDTILSEGFRKPNRTGIDTISHCGYMYKVPVSFDAFPILTSKSVHWKSLVSELIWILSGEVSARILDKHSNKIWKEWTDADNNITAGYGPLLRNFPTKDGKGNDQLKFVVNELKRSPSSRRLILTLWNPEHSQKDKLPCCHYTSVLNMNPAGVLNLHMTQRSCDTALGVPFNLSSYALLLCIICKLTNMKPGNFIHTLVDAHVYTTSLEGKFAGDASFDHIPGLKEQLERKTFALPKLLLPDKLPGDKEWTLENLSVLFDLDTQQLMEVFQLESYQNSGKLPFKVAV